MKVGDPRINTGIIEGTGQVSGGFRVPQSKSQVEDRYVRRMLSGCSDTRVEHMGCQGKIDCGRAPVRNGQLVCRVGEL